MADANTIAAVVGLAAAAIIYGTDFFCALVLRPAAAAAAEASVADLIGHVHEYGDRRLPFPGVVSVIAAALVTALGGEHPLTRIAGAIALVALLSWLAIYARVSAPINRRLRAAASANTVPPDTRSLQDRWDRVIWARASLQAIAVAGLLAAVLGR
jgi:uncharacterized membrane protein